VNVAARVTPQYEVAPRMTRFPRQPPPPGSLTSNRVLPQDPWGKENPVYLSDGIELLYTSEQCHSSVFDKVPHPLSSEPTTFGLFDRLLDQQCRQLAINAITEGPEEAPRKPDTAPYRPPHQPQAPTPSHQTGWGMPFALPPLDRDFSLTHSPFPLSDILRQHRSERQVSWPRKLDFLLEHRPLEDLVTHVMSQRGGQCPYLGELLFDLALELSQKAGATENQQPKLLSDLYRHASWYVVFLRLFVRLTLPQFEVLKQLVPMHPLRGFEKMEPVLLNSYNESKRIPITKLVVDRADVLRREHPGLYST
jgi:hypothetical protein